MARPKSDKVTQREMVLTALQEKGWGTGPKDLQVVIKDKYQKELPPNVISNYKSQLKKQGGKAPGKRGRKPGASKAGMQFTDLEAVCGLVNRLGADQVKKLVDMAGMFS